MSKTYETTNSPTHQPTYLNLSSHERELVEPVRTRTQTSMAA